MKHLFLFLFSCACLSAENAPLLHAQGTGKVLVKTTLADLRLGVEVEGKNNAGVEKELSDRMNQLTVLLKKYAPLALDVSSFSVYPEYSDEKPPRIKGYRGNAEIMVTLLNEAAGSAISAAMEAGATKVNGIELKASQEALQEARQAAIEKAAANSLVYAETALKALTLEFDRIVEVKVNPEESPRPFRAGLMAAKTASPLELEGEEAVEVNISIQVQFKYP